MKTKNFFNIKNIMWCFISLTILAVTTVNVHIATNGQNSFSDLTLQTIESLSQDEKKKKTEAELKLEADLNKVKFDVSVTKNNITGSVGIGYNYGAQKGAIISGSIKWKISSK